MNKIIKEIKYRKAFLIISPCGKNNTKQCRNLLELGVKFYTEPIKLPGLAYSIAREAHVHVQSSSEWIHLNLIFNSTSFFFFNWCPTSHGQATSKDWWGGPKGGQLANMEARQMLEDNLRSKIRRLTEVGGGPGRKRDWLYTCEAKGQGHPTCNWGTWLVKVIIITTTNIYWVQTVCQVLSWTLHIVP